MSKKKQIKHIEVKILDKYCKGCGLCVSVCEIGKLEMNNHPNKRGVETPRCALDIQCTACLKCTAVCPGAAIEIYRIESQDDGK